MKLLQDYASPLPKLLKDQQVREGEPYRLIRYVIQQPVDDGILLYNVLTKAVALLTPDDIQEMEEDLAKVVCGSYRLR